MLKVWHAKNRGEFVVFHVQKSLIDGKCFDKLRRELLYVVINSVPFLSISAVYSVKEAQQVILAKSWFTLNKTFSEFS